MKLIDRYIISRLAVLFLVILLSVVSLYVLIDLVTRTRTKIIEQEVPARIVALYYLNYIPTVVLQMTPLAFLLASLFVLGNFARNNEYTALLAGGVSLYRFVIAPVALGAFVTLCALGLGELLLPPASRRAEYLEKTHFKERKPSREVAMTWSRPDLGRTYVIRKYNRAARSGKEVLITEERDGTIRKKVEAETIFWNADQHVWVLESATVIEIEPQSEKRRAVDRMAAPIEETPEILEAGQRSADEKSFAELRRELTHLARSGLVYPEKWVNLHAKMALPVTSFIILFLAIPFALKVKRGGTVASLGIGVGIGVGYMGLFEVGQALGRAQYIAPWIAAWAPNMIFLVAGLCLTMRTET